MARTARSAQQIASDEEIDQIVRDSISSSADGGEASDEEIDNLVRGVVSGQLPDGRRVEKSLDLQLEPSPERTQPSMSVLDGIEPQPPRPESFGTAPPTGAQPPMVSSSPDQVRNEKRYAAPDTRLPRDVDRSIVSERHRIQRRNAGPLLPIPLPDMTDQDYRTAVLMANSMAGSLAGAPLAPVTGGGSVLFGGAVGSMAGSYMADAMGLDASSTPDEAAARATTEGALSVAIPKAVGGVVQGAGKAGRWALDKFVDLRPELLAMARRYGITPTLEMVSGNRMLRAARRVLAPLPGLGTPFEDASERAAREVNAQAPREFSRAFPITPLTPQEQARAALDPVAASTYAVNDAAETYAARKQVADNAYMRLRNLVDEEQPIIPTTAVREAIGELGVTKGARGIPVTPPAPPPKPPAPPRGQYDPPAPPDDPEEVPLTRYLFSSEEAPSLALARRFANIGDAEGNLTARQHAEFVQELDNVIERAKAGGFYRSMRELIQLKNAAAEDFANLEGPDEIRQLARNAKAAYAAAESSVDNPVAQRFTRVNKKMWRPGYDEPGATNPDAILPKIIDGESPAAISPMGMEQARTVFPNAFPPAYRQHMQAKWDEAVDVASGSGAEIAGTIKVAESFEKALGLNEGNTARRQATAVALRGTGATVESLERFVEFTKNISRQLKPPDANAYQARRTMLSGSILPMMMVDYWLKMGGGSVALALAAFGGARTLGKIVTSPAALRYVEQMMATRSTDAARLYAGTNLVRLLATGGADPLDQSGMPMETYIPPEFNRPTPYAPVPDPSGGPFKPQPKGQTR